MQQNPVILELTREIRKAVVGKDDIILRVLTAILARGHVLLEDVPGVGKTTLALAFSKALGLRYQRVQFTPDVMPSDLTGYSILNRETGKMEYRPGALLCNLFLADELNRTTSRTQSALLEAMEEGQVTVDGDTYLIPRPFLVIATQNPTGSAGTQLLPNSQMDRFTLRLSMGYPDRAAEIHMIRARQEGNPLEQVKQVIDHMWLERLREETDQVYLSDDVLDYLLRLIEATRRSNVIRQGASPRAALALAAVSRARAYVEGRDYVIPEDVSELFLETIAHRILYTTQVGVDRQENVLTQILTTVKAPKLR